MNLSPEEFEDKYNGDHGEINSWFSPRAIRIRKCMARYKNDKNYYWFAHKCIYDYVTDESPSQKLYEKIVKFLI